MAIVVLHVYCFYYVFPNISLFSEGREIYLSFVLLSLLQMLVDVRTQAESYLLISPQISVY